VEEETGGVRGFGPVRYGEGGEGGGTEGLLEVI
jgi:hypothetical protein